MQTQKFFNVGLTLDTDYTQLNEFLLEYAPYIKEVYFSLPLGERFQTRSNIGRQFENAATVALFWDMLALIKRFDIRLELVLNTYHLSENDVACAAKMLQERKVDVDSVCVLDEYYAWAVRYFPNKEYVFSYNNGLKRLEDIRAVKNRYDYFVVGNCNIRNNELISYLHGEGIKPILLVNNGCSFHCNCCKSSRLCKEVFERNLQTYGLDYLYAEQSLFPCELQEGFVHTSLVDMLKISNRSSPIPYLKKCIDSYSGNRVLKYIEESAENFSLWGRLGHFWPLFKDINLQKVIEHKQRIWGKELPLQ